MDNNTTPQRTIILGVTKEGRHFRPSDWGERLCGRLATFKGQRICYSPLLRPGIYNGTPCIIVESALSEQQPELYHHIMDFAQINHLQVIDEPSTPAIK